MSVLLRTSIIFVFLFLPLKSDEIPIIVIAPSKSPQSISTVGTSVSVLDESTILTSDESFLGNIIGSNTTGNNFFQTGGAGTQMGLQLRGLPKAYTTVFVDGVKKSDASTPKNDFYFDDILTGSISRVEVLKGNQSTIYGSGAMGGTINIYSKQGSGDFKTTTNYQTGSNRTHDLNFSFGGSDEAKDLYIGLERFQTDGISAMTHNDESDGYTNHTFLTNYGLELNEKIKVRSILKLVDSELYYDAITSTFDQVNNYSHETDASAVFKINFQPNDKLKSDVIFNKAYMRRAADNVVNQFQNYVIDQTYYSNRETVSLENNFKYNANHNIVFGFEKEFEEMRYNPYDENGVSFKSAQDVKKGEEISSQYFDVQSNFGKKLYTTAGIRFDQHSQDIDEDSMRFTAAFLSDKIGGKLKTSYGTGVKFPSLYEYLSSANPGRLAPERGTSYDFGLEKSFINQALNLNITYFNHKYENTIEGWSSVSFAPGNVAGVVRTRGLELLSQIQPNKKLNLNLNYTYTSTYDGADFDDPNLGPNSAGDFSNSQMVRVPRHLLNIGASYELMDNINLNWHTKYSDTVRDYGNVNAAGGNFRDMRLDSYSVTDLGLDVKLRNTKAFLKFSNIFNEKYSQALQFAAPERSFNLGFKKLY